MEGLKALWAKIKAWFMGAEVKVKAEFEELEDKFDSAKDKLENKFESAKDKVEDKFKSDAVSDAQEDVVKADVKLDEAAKDKMDAESDLAKAKLKK